MFSQIPIAQARLLSVGTADVTIQGLVLNGDEFGDVRYIEDLSGGIAVYDPLVVSNRQIGDEVVLTGTLSVFNGLLQLINISSSEVLSSGNILPLPQLLLPNGMNSTNEAELVKMENVHFLSSGNFESGTYAITNGIQNGIVYIRAGHPLIGTPIPPSVAHITGVVSIFNEVYQLLPRGEGDIESLGALYFTVPLVQAEINTHNTVLHWITNIPSTAVIKYGLTPSLEIGQLNETVLTTDHYFSINELEPAQFYYVQITAYTTDETIAGGTKYISTRSESSGEINVYFNFPVNNEPAWSYNAVYYTPAQMEEKIIEKINEAMQTVDVSIYGFNRQPILGALNNAVQRGVRVRLVTDELNAEQMLANVNTDFPYILSNSDGLMHNKFMVTDAATIQNSWVITGSMNWTDSNIWDDPNNVLFIQDQALAKAYTIEFEEQWGSHIDEPDEANAKFGSAKADNTPHQFNIGGVMTESYFSPSDHTNDQILRSLETADYELAIGLFSFTENSFGSVIVQKFDEGIEVLGIIENIEDSGAEYQYLVENSVPVYAHSYPGQFHHKYGIIDYWHPESDPMVITGSHNWTFSADNINDENTLILHDANWANVYFQEFIKRLCEISVANCYTGIDTEGSIFTPSLYPQPANGWVRIVVQESAIYILSIMDMNGRIIESIYPPQKDEISLNTTSLPTGIYLLGLHTSEGVRHIKFAVQH